MLKIENVYYVCITYHAESNKRNRRVLRVVCLWREVIAHHIRCYRMLLVEDTKQLLNN